MGNWESECDDNIDGIIAEQYYFIHIENNGEIPVYRKIQRLDNLTMDYASKATKSKLVDIFTAAAALDAVFSFGLGMVLFLPLQIASVYAKGSASDAAEALHTKMSSIDHDIAADIGVNAEGFIKKYKANNNLISAKGINISPTESRTFLFQFMAEVHRRAGKLDAKTFRQYAACARIIYSGDEIQKVYDALKLLEKSTKKEADVRKFLYVLNDFNLPDNDWTAVHLVRGFSIAYMVHNLEIENEVISTIAQSENILLENVSVGAFNMVDAMKFFSKGLISALSIVEIFCDIVCIPDIIVQTYKLLYAIEDDIQPNYQQYFESIYNAAQSYKAAIALEVSDELCSTGQMEKLNGE